MNIEICPSFAGGKYIEVRNDRQIIKEQVTI
jgi:hypothetical protein